MRRLIFFTILTILFSIPFAQSQTRRDARAGRRVERKDDRREARAKRRDMTGQIQISGAFALYPMVVRWADEFRKLHPSVRIDISAGGAGKGITDALTGMVDIGMVSREIHAAETAKGAFVITVANDAVVPTINTRNPLIRTILYTGLTLKAARDLWNPATSTTWGAVLGTNSTIPTHVYTRSDACGAAETWAAYLGTHQESLGGTAVFGDPGVASVVQRDKLAIGYNNLAYVYDGKSRRPYHGIMVMPLDLNTNGRIDLNENFYATADQLMEAIADGRYPAPPARKLYLVLSGKPDKQEVLAFLEYLLTEGQKYAKESFYIPLTEAEAEAQLLKLE